MTERKPQTHIVFVDIDEEHEDAFNRWYETVHVPEILACPGWLDARREICLEGAPKHVAIYTVSGPEAYETPEFNAIKGFGPFSDKVRNFRRVRLTTS